MVSKIAGTTSRTCHPSVNVAADLLFTHATGTTTRRLPFAETQQVQRPAVPDDARQAGGVNRPLVVVEHMEQTAVQRGVERSPEPFQGEHVCHQELRRRAESTLASLADRLADRTRRRVDPQDPRTTLGQRERVLARPAPHVDHVTDERAAPP